MEIHRGPTPARSCGTRAQGGHTDPRAQLACPLPCEAAPVACPPRHVDGRNGPTRAPTATSGGRVATGWLSGDGNCTAGKTSQSRWCGSETLRTSAESALRGAQPSKATSPHTGTDAHSPQNGGGGSENSVLAPNGILASVLPSRADARPASSPDRALRGDTGQRGRLPRQRGRRARQGRRPYRLSLCKLPLAVLSASEWGLPTRRCESADTGRDRSVGWQPLSRAPWWTSRSSLGCSSRSGVLTIGTLYMCTFS